MHIVKSNKKYLLVGFMKMKSWIACVGVRVGMFNLRALFFVLHARIGLLIEPGQETEKIIIVP